MNTLESVRLALGTAAAPGAGIVIETSGTTATPKRVRLSARALRASAEAVHERLGGPGQWLLALPTTYVAGANVLVRSVLADAEPIVMPSGPFTAVAFAHSVELMTGSRRYTALVPVQLARLLEGAQHNAQVRASVAKLDAILVGGQASGEQQLARARDLGWKVIVTYGSTETCGGAVYDGVPLEGVDVRIVAGEIWIGGATLADGFENADASADAELTAARFVERDGQRWFRTDDAGELMPASGGPEHGGGERLVVTGRRDRVIISGGIKISLSAIEDATRQLTGVVDCLAVGAVNDEWGQRPVLVVELGEGAHVTTADIERHIELTLGHVSVPDRMLIEPLPRNANGKPDAKAFLARVHR
jgi:O-succinylbenzoic acid--CoA ligase